MKQIELNQGGLKFIKSALETGDHLAKGLLHTVSLKNGAIWTFLPDIVDPSKLSLEQGGLSKFDYDEDLWSPVVERISSFLKSSTSNLCVIEATSIKPDQVEGWLANRPEGFKHFTARHTYRRASDPKTGGEIDQIGVYGFMMADQAEPAYIRDFIDEAFPFQQIGALISLPKGKAPNPGQQVEPAWLEALSSRTQYIFAGAYDGSGWVIWSLTQPSGRE